MSKFISGKEIIEKYDLSNNELFKLVTEKGLTPFDQFERLLLPPGIAEEITSKISLKEEEFINNGCYLFFDKDMGVNGKDLGTHYLISGYLIPKKEIASCKNLHNEINDLKNEFELKKANSWHGYQLPYGKGAGEAMNALLSAIYHLDQVENKTGFLQKDSDKKSISVFLSDISSEVELLYDSIKLQSKNLRLSMASMPRGEIKKSVVETIIKQKTKFKYIETDYLDDNELYDLNIGKERRDFIGRLLQKILLQSGLGNHSYQKLYGQYSKIQKRPTD